MKTMMRTQPLHSSSCFATSSLFLLLLPALFSSAAAIGCYECDSSKNFTCTEFWDPHLDIPIPYLSPDCSHVFEATHCIKMTGVFDEKLGTKRFCSSKTWGNYCEYIKRPGDIQEYRSCIFSCSTYGCNVATDTKMSLPVLITPFSLALTTLVH